MPENTPDQGENTATNAENTAQNRRIAQEPAQDAPSTQSAPSTNPNDNNTPQTGGEEQPKHRKGKRGPGRPPKKHRKLNKLEEYRKRQRAERLAREKDTIKKLGRPPIYGPKFDELVRKMAQMGWTNERIAEHMGISSDTLYLWCREHPSFLKNLKFGKVNRNAEVVDRLYDRAMGEKIKAIKIFNNKGKIIKVPYIEQLPVDVEAAKFILTNRTDTWAEKTEQKVESTQSGGPPIILVKVEGCTLPQAKDQKAIAGGAVIEAVAVEAPPQNAQQEQVTTNQKKSNEPEKVINVSTVGIQKPEAQEKLIRRIQIA